MDGWLAMLVLGILYIVGGFFALVYPLPASLGVEIFVGWSFLLLGILQALYAFSAEGWGGKIWTFLLGLLAAFVGITLLANPIAGIATLTVVVAILFLAAGLTKIMIGFKVHDATLKWGIVLSGIVSGLLGILILSYLPGSAAFTLGLMLGIELVSDGVTMIALSLAVKSNDVEKTA